MASKSPGACVRIFVHLLTWQGLWGSCGNELGPVWEFSGWVGTMGGGRTSIPHFPDLAAEGICVISGRGTPTRGHGGGSGAHWVGSPASWVKVCPPVTPCHWAIPVKAPR